jgi:8-oxo-dGTP pyrophosphatase MutT (NUDIX family)
VEGSPVPEQPRHPSRRDVAVAALLDDDDRVLLVRTRRLPGYWQPVGGGLEPGDRSFPDAAARELREELGLDLAPEALRYEFRASYDFGDGEVRFFSARLPRPRVRQLVPNLEEIEELCWSSLAAALELPAFPATRRFLEYLSHRLGSPPLEIARGLPSGVASDIARNRAQSVYQPQALNDG